MEQIGSEQIQNKTNQNQSQDTYADNNENIIESKNDQTSKHILSELSCIICSEIFYQPVTLACGHSFCKECISRALYIQPLCPICKGPNLSDPQFLKENLIMRNLIEGTQEYQQKLKKIEKEKQEQKELQQEQEENQNENQKQIQQFRNLFVIWIKKKNYFFPQNKDEIIFEMNISHQDFKEICPDWHVCIGFKQEKNELLNNQQSLPIFTSKAQLQSIQSLGSNLFKSKIQIQERIKVTKIKNLNQDDFKINENLNHQIEEQKQENNSNNFNINTDQKFSLELADGLYFSDDISSFSQQQIQNLKGQGKKALETIDYIIKNNIHEQSDTGIDFTSQAIIQKLQQFNFYQLFENRENLSIEQVSQISLVFPGIFNINQQKLHRLFETDDLIERMVIFNEELDKCKETNNLNAIFKLSNFGSGITLLEDITQVVKKNSWIIVIIIALIFSQLIKS
ncbi:hypothetical protein PPERSA_04115 [Pseudocohnilembus persalinus]|uniref:RING-type domain-containing protein n=1 Tax=Pseudocohnilembus persalinus TaxID=266149 RepID=A0A0V0QMR7_PSEPJ|nr:hypothetical protein PPERSA_04115 [Pseudocohnilembus persalinus]|eukprot:KRX03563.1 hypothetical protein PPERSA_04115 [Pseudocohnilembus persalinus]